MGRMDFDKMNEAFKAGNRARKRESVQDAVESVDSIQAQIELFKKQTGIELEIKDGRPYFGGDLDLYNCTKLTSLPAGLKVGGYLDLTGCTGLTSLPAGLKVEGWLTLEGCTGLTSLPFDLVIQGDSNWIVQHGVLTPFFKKLGIPVSSEGDTKASDWRRWQEAHGYLTEAFRAGNKARKKEAVTDAVADMHNPLQDQIDRFREQTGEKLEIKDGRPYYKGNLDLIHSETFDPDIPENLFVDGNFHLGMHQTKLPAGLTVTGVLDLNMCTKMHELPANVTTCDLLLACSGIKEVPKDLNITGSFIIYSPHDHKLDKFFRDECGLQPITVNSGISRSSQENRIIGFSWNRWRTVGKPDFDKIHNMLTANEAFKAGNRARKKEAITDTVSVGLTPEQQVKLFMADVMKYREWLIQQRKNVEGDRVNPDEDNEAPVGVYYNDGIDDVFRIEGDKVVIRSIVEFTDYPYEIHFPEKVQCNALVNLINCTGLTSLPDGMYVQDHLNLEGCSSLRRLPEDLYVGYDLYLEGCTGLESLPSNFTVNWGDLNLENCPNIKEIPLSANLVRGRIVFSPDSELHRFFIKNDIGYATEGINNSSNPRKWHICDFSRWNNWKIYGITEAFKAGNRARKKESVQDTVETLDAVDFPTVMRSPANLISELAKFLHRLGYKVADERKLRDSHHMQNDNPIYQCSLNFTNSSYGNWIRISLGRHPVWNERLQRFISTGLILCIEATDRMYYRVQFLPADKEIEESVQFLNCSSRWFEAWEKPDGTRWGKPRNEAALTDNSIPAVWPNLFRNILTAAKHPEYVFVPDKTYTKCWSFEKPSEIDEAFKAGNRARKQEAVQDTVQKTGEYRPVTREVFKEVVDSFISPQEGPISGKVYRRYDQHMTGQSLANYLNRVLELCGYKDIMKAEVVFEDDSCDGVQITDDKNYSISRFAVQYSREYVCVQTGSMDRGMPALLYAYRNLPDMLEIHLEGIDTLNADLREYIKKFG